MSARDDIGPYVLLAGGLAALYFATKKKPREASSDRSGEKCDPSDGTPHGYACMTDGNDFVLERNASHFIGYSPYVNRQQVDEVLGRLGFPGGDLRNFQIYMTQTSPYTLRQDGDPDPQTMKALRYAEDLHTSGKWKAPE